MKVSRAIGLASLAVLLGLPAYGAGGEVFFPERAVLDPFPREVPLGRPLTLRVKPGRGYSSPVLVTIRPDGTTEYRHPDRVAGGKAEFDARFGHGRGVYRMELVVDSAKGDLTAARFGLYVGVPRPREGPGTGKRLPESAYPPEPAAEHPFRLERRLFRRINDLRRSRRLDPWPWLEKAAVLAREHWKRFLSMKPRPEKLVHVLPGSGSLADGFMDTFAWPWTVRKFPPAKPDIGPEAPCYCSEALAAPLSLDWLFREVLTRESAFLAPLLSPFPTHAAVGIVRDPASGRLYTAVVFVQVNSTRVRKELEAEWRETTAQEGRARKPGERAEILRRLGRMSDPRSRKLIERRLRDRSPLVRAAALDALFLTDPDAARAFLDRRTPALVRAHRRGRYAAVVPLLKTLAAVRYDAATRARGEKELETLDRFSGTMLESAAALLAEGKVREAHRELSELEKRFAGTGNAKEARRRRLAIEADPELKSKLEG